MITHNLPQVSADIDQRVLPPLSIRKPSEILSMKFDPSDLLLENGYLTKGNSLVIAGAGGVGKSRFVMQMAIHSVLGKPFLGWPTRGRGHKWLLLQTENSNRRLQADLSKMLSRCSKAEIEILDGCLMIHTLETDADSIVALSNPETFLRIEDLLKQFRADVVVFDILRDFGTGDLNSDEEMTQTCQQIGRVTRTANLSRIPVVVHHSLSGRAGAMKATGFDRGSFGRNSKVLQGWARAQINIAPFSEDSNEQIVISSGKANDAVEFEPFSATLDPQSMTYELEELFDLSAWQARVSTTKRKSPVLEPKDVVAVLKACGQSGAQKKDLVASIMAEKGCCRSLAYRTVEGAEEAQMIIRRKSDQVYVLPRTSSC